MSLKVKKEFCVLNLELTRYFVWTTKWKIDVCRDPIHMKVGYSLDEILKKTMNCNFQAKKNSFCQEFEKLSSVIEDNLLIFAKGEKESLDTDHGKSYCSFELIKKYLDRNKIFSRYENYPDEVFTNEDKRKVEAKTKDVEKIMKTPSSGNEKNEVQSEKKVDKFLKKKIENVDEIIKEAQNPDIKLENTEPEEIKIPTEKIEI